ncbi:PHD finger protein 3 [Plectropomus leopardus]|uniref:PHD finger protein 3 n=1 Tax=Plectropomus leopardus TaxID=160734 RepID=UPI001C4BC261|nr:PHD finger protein 3 [Plectropomus leopardus]XP_042358062.1 PHD finger protein 3 [Plectropomus leopardus]
MDIVDTFNHLIPSDQLDDTLIAGQNLECEGSNEFGTGHPLEDSLKNMLSDKDPMFGCASSQFNLLDNEDPAFPIAGSTGLADGSAPSGLGSELTVGETTQVSRPVGKQKKRPRYSDDEYCSDPQPSAASNNNMNRARSLRKPANRLRKSFLIEKGVKGAQLKRELTLGGRINVNDLERGIWLNPSVVLRRLTVTIAGFRIELLPGPSYTQTVAASESVCLDDGFSYAGDIGFTVLQDEAVSVQNPTPEDVAEADDIKKSSSEDAALGLGPYVNPNDVQTSSGTLMGSACTQETKLNNQGVPKKQKPVSKVKTDIKEPQNTEDKINTVSSKTEDKEKQQMVAKTLLKSKQGLTPNKNKDLVSAKPNNMIQGHKVSPNMPSKIQREDLHKMKSQKEKKEISPLKRPAENTQVEHANKMQKMQGTGESKVKPKSPSTPSPVMKKNPSSANRVDQQGPAKHPSNVSKVESSNPTHSRPSYSLKLPEEGQEKPKLKKPEKILQRQKSKTSRSISVEEPQLFIPDNAPVVKKETAEEQAANSESVWDGNNCCGQCKKHHNNMFMVGCGRCDDWFHGDCVGLDLTKVREMEEEDQMYVCLKCCEEESKKVEPEPLDADKLEAPAKTEVQDLKQPPQPQPGPSQTQASWGVRPVRKEPDRRQSTDARETAHKTGFYLKQETKSKTSSSVSKKPVSVEAIRRSVRDSLKEILIQRLKESDLNVSVERASEVAKKTERELFHLYKDTDNKYKNKYRSLMFNLKDTKNNVLFKRVLKGEISPGNLIRMSPEELASKELAAWRQRENRHTIEMIEKEQREAERRPITKITHKGEIEIESQEPVKEPVKAPEPVELKSPAKLTEVSAEPPKTPENKTESTKMEKDTTSQHKSHLFDLHCKICTGRMAPPVEEAPTKVIKVATTVVRRQSTKAEETKSTTPAIDDDLHLTVLEESFRNAQSVYEGRSDHITGRDEEAAFLSNLKSLWRGFIHMHSVAKFVTKAFPVSGVLDSLTEDLPDSIQVGGRISPQTVWDYLEKIRATGTKEVCLIRFSPETEEDEISYTLLYAYFSSRRRFGVVSNNLKQVKDMYLIPLGATEKVPHQLVPFDGPGLENNHANLLLGLIIRQRPKRDFLPVDMNESARIIPEIPPITITTKETRDTEEDEKIFLSTLTTAHKKEKDKPLNSAEDVDEPVTEPLEEPSASEETNNQEPRKPLRFLPGVLVGWGGELPPLPDVGGKPATTADDTQKTQPAPKTEASTGNSKSPTAAAPRERFVIKKKETKPVKAEQELSNPTDTSAANNSSAKDAAVVTHGALVSLKDKPPDVSTEAFLASLSAAPSETETNSAASANKGDAGLLSETEKASSEEDPLSQSKSQAAPAHTNSSKPPLSGILKKSSAYCSASEDKTTVQQKDKASQPAPSSPKPVPVLSSTRNEPVTLFHQGYLQLSQPKKKTEEEKQTTIRSFSCEEEDAGLSQAGATVTQTVYPPSVQEPQAACYTEASELDHNSAMTPVLPVYNSAAPIPSQQQQQPQVPGSYDYPTGPPQHSFSSLHTQDQNHSTPWAQDSTSYAFPGLQSQYAESYPEPAGRPPSLAKDYKRLDERYSDPWERPRTTEDRDQHERRHSHHRDTHHAKKSRHHGRERDKKHERSRDREKSRHHGHSDDRYGEKRKERHHSDDHSSRHKDRHRHRRDSDYENGRRSSKDS